jgi:glycosyltransferase involved in cell wall biosynthesis
MRASIIIPVLNVEPQLRQTMGRLVEIRGDPGLDLELLMVVDVPDPAREDEARRENDRVASEMDAKAVYRIGERGFGSALRFGFDHATGEAVIPFMADACDDPEDIPRLVATLEEGWDVVAGSRYMPGGRIVGNTLKQRLSRLYGALVRLAGGPRIHDVSNAFKGYRREVVEEIPTVAESFDISVELTLRAEQAGFRVTEIPTTWTNRQLGRSSWRFSNELRRYSRWLWLAARGTRAARRDAVPRSPRSDRS